MGRMSGAARVAGCMVAVGALAGCWPAPGAGPDRHGFNPFEQRLTIDNVSSLAQMWSTDVPGIDRPVGLVTAEGVVVVTGRYGVAGLDLDTGGVVWPSATNAAGSDVSSAAAIPPPPWNLPATIDDGEVHQPWQLADRRADRLDLHTGAPLGTLADPYLAFRGTRRLIEDIEWVGGTYYVDEYFRVDDAADPGSSWGGLLSDLSRTGYAAQSTSLGSDRVYGAGAGLMTAEPGDGTLAPGVRAFTPDRPSTCGPVDRPLYACPAWVTPIDGYGLATAPVIGTGERSVYAVSDVGTVYALDAATGEAEWTARVADSGLPQPALADGNLFVPTATGVSVFAADGCGAPECAPAWTIDIGAPVASQPSVAGGVLYVAAGGVVSAYDAEGCGATTCEAVWSANVGQPVTTSPIPVSGRLLVAAQDGTVIAYRPAVAAG